MAARRRSKEKRTVHPAKKSIDIAHLARIAALLEIDTRWVDVDALGRAIFHSVIRSRLKPMWWRRHLLQIVLPLLLSRQTKKLHFARLRSELEISSVHLTVFHFWVDCLHHIRVEARAKRSAYEW